MSGKVQKQIRLPMSRAIEIAWKQIRLRLARSMLVTSGIVLAIAFLLSIQIGDLVAAGMRGWIEDSQTSAEFAELRAERERLSVAVRDSTLALRDQVIRASAAKPQTQQAFDVKRAVGADLDGLKQELGQLPADAKQVQAALDASPEVQKSFGAWVEEARRYEDVRERVSAPQLLTAKLADQGVPTTPADIEAAKLQQRWLLGLALLVAFVGILNAMLMSVTERFREIGTMKCLGALDGFIVKLFVIESLFQGIVGTLVGILLGLAVALAMAGATYGNFAFVNLPWTSVLGVTAMCTAIGIVLTVMGAIFPAWQAAKMHPIAAMRVEA